MSADRSLQRRYLGVCGLLIGFAGAFFLLQLLPLPLFWYLPLEGHFALALRPPGLAMDFYGRTLWAALVGASLYPLGWWLGGGAKLSREQTWLAVGYGLALVLLAMLLIAYQIWPRPPAPLPLPAWYKAR